MERKKHNRKYGIPDTSSSDLNSFTSWSTASGAMDSLAEYGIRMQKLITESRRIHTENTAGDLVRNYGTFESSLRGILGKTRGFYGSSVDSSIRTSLDKIVRKGGKNISNSNLSSIIGGLQKRIETIANNVGGEQGDVLKGFSDSLKTAKIYSAKGGYKKLGSLNKDAIKATTALSKNTRIETTRDDISKRIRSSSRSIVDPKLKKSVSDIRRLMDSRIASERTTLGKQRAMWDAYRKLKGLSLGATGADKGVIDSLVSNVKSGAFGLTKDLAKQSIHRVLLRANNSLLGLTKAVAGTMKYLVPIKKGLDASNAIFQGINNKANQFARMQIGIAAERGAYGRKIRGAGIGFSDIMTAVAAGRRAGMDDSTVVNQMANLHEQLARARWGESDIIDKAGRWGISVYDNSGRAKSGNQMMIEFSRKLNSMKDAQEKLQFLSHLGFRPEQLEYVANYEREANRWDEIKRNPRLQGTLESARIFDESGMYAKADAATKIELKRRQILNQNAIDDGILSGLARSLHPENWWFQDWTARQKGVAVAKSEIAQEKLVKALNQLQNALDRNGKALSGNTSALATLSIDDLAALGLEGGMAKSSIANLGTKSQYIDLRKAFAQQYGLKDLTDVEKKNKVASGVLGGIAGTAVGGGAGVLAGAAAGLLITAITGGAALPFLIGGGVLGGLGGGFWGAGAGVSTPLSMFGDDSEKMIGELRSARTQNDLNKVLKKYNLENSGLTVSHVRSKEFQQDDDKARGVLQAAWLNDTNIKANAMLGKGHRINPLDDSWQTDPYYLAMKEYRESIGTSVTKEDIARAKARQVDKSIVSAKEAYLRVKNIASEPLTEQEGIELEQEKQRIRNNNPDMDESHVQDMAMKKIITDRQKNISSDIVDLAYQYKGVSKEDKEKAEKRIRDISGIFSGVFLDRNKSSKEIDAEIKKKQQKIADIENKESEHRAARYETEVKESLQDDVSKLEELKKAREVIEEYNDNNNIPKNIAKALDAGEDTPINSKNKYDRADAFNKKYWVDIYREGESAERTMARLRSKLEGTGETAEDVGSHIMTENEANWLTSVQERGGEVTQEDLHRLEVFKLTKAGKKWMRSKESVKKANAEEKKKKEEKSEIDEEIERRFGSIIEEGSGSGSSKESKGEPVFIPISDYLKGNKNIEEIEKGIDDRKKKISEIAKREKEGKADALEIKIMNSLESQVSQLERIKEGSGSGSSKESKGGGEDVNEANVLQDNLSDKDIKVFRKAKALGKDLKSGATESQIKAFNIIEAERGKKWESLGLGTKEDYEQFREEEDSYLRGEKIPQNIREKVERVQKQLDSTSPVSKNLGFGADKTRERQYSKRFLELIDKAEKYDQGDKDIYRKSYGWPIYPTASGKEPINNFTTTVDKEKQVIERIQSNVEQGVRAASSAQSFIKESGTQSSQNVTINMGGQTVNQNIDAQIPLDAPHIKEATTSGMKDGVSEVAQTLLSVMQSKNIF